MELNSGYTQTEIGPIPKDWELNELQTYWSVTDCKHITAKFYTSGIPVASIRETQARFVDLSEAKLTNEFYYIKLCEGGRKPLPGDLIYSRNATVGEVAQVSAEHPSFALGQDVCLLRRRRLEYSPDFLQLFLKSGFVQKQLLDAMVGSTFKRVNIAQIKSVKVAMPSPSEQHAIGSALSDMDAALEGLERLIAKKRDLKQAAMQPLLTGKTRLPGFSGEWKLRRLGDVGDIRSGGTPSTVQPDFWDGGIPWCTPTDITALAGHKYLAKTTRTISAAGLRSSSAETIPQNSLIMTSRATIGECAINSIPITTNQGFKNIVPDDETDIEFLYYLMTTKKQALVALCGGSTFLEIGKRQLVTFQILVPPTKGEQNAIAAFLSDMDAEIGALAAQVEKAQLLKLAMMQQLLTGRIRLPFERTPNG